MGVNVAVVGATGAVGREIIKILEERNFPLDELRLAASHRSEGKILEYKETRLKVENLEKFSFRGVDIVLSSPGAAVSRSYAPRAVEEGAVVVDNTSAFRMDEDVPLVVPEVNPHKAGEHKGLISNPNCSTIQLVVVLKPLHDAAVIKRVVVSTYQAVSGAGTRAVSELREQCAAVLEGKKPECGGFPHPVAFNMLPHIDSFLENGYTREEMKMSNETRKIMGDDSIRVTATTVRVPVFVGHSESVNIEFEKNIDPEEARLLLGRAPGISVADSPAGCVYPMPADCAGKDEVFVGRIRKDDSVPSGLNLWVVADNLRKGAALNTVQIAELLVKG